MKVAVPDTRPDPHPDSPHSLPISTVIDIFRLAGPASPSPYFYGNQQWGPQLSELDVPLGPRRLAGCLLLKANKRTQGIFLLPI